MRGAELFHSKGCIDCHSFSGAGGNTASDLAQPNAATREPMQVASALWNHAPRMWRAQEPRHIRPVLDSMQTADLFAYFFSLAYFNAPGNASRGRTLFEESCASCHETTASVPRNLRQRTLGPPISTWTAVAEPLVWTEQMWNHSGKIFDELSRAGGQWRQFTTQDVGDLLAYLRTLPETRSQAATFQPGNPEQGRITFERSCESCHSFGNRTADPKIDLLKRQGPVALTGYIAAMWNHAPVMHARAGTRFPVLGPGDMSNLVAYLFAERYFYEEGNVDKGGLVFRAKCVVCHEQRRKETGAADLTQLAERYSPITMSAAIWRHGLSMFVVTQQQNLVWPNLTPAEMSDLITYLNSRLVTRIARPN